MRLNIYHFGIELRGDLGHDFGVVIIGFYHQIVPNGSIAGEEAEFREDFFASNESHKQICCSELSLLEV